MEDEWRLETSNKKQKTLLAALDKILTTTYSQRVSECHDAAIATEGVTVLVPLMVVALVNYRAILHRLPAVYYG